MSTVRDKVPIPARLDHRIAWRNPHKYPCASAGRQPNQDELIQGPDEIVVKGLTATVADLCKSTLGSEGIMKNTSGIPEACSMTVPTPDICRSRIGEEARLCAPINRTRSLSRNRECGGQPAVQFPTRAPSRGQSRHCLLALCFFFRRGNVKARWDVHV